MFRNLLAACFVLALLAGTPLPGTAHTNGATVVLAAEKTPLVDLNSASRAELMKLPAVGEAIADKIIAGRPWKSKYDLVVKKVVTRAAYDKFAKYVIARQPGGAASPN